MRYVIVSVVDKDAGDFNNNLRKDVFYKFKAKSSKLPAHFTIKSPFEADNIDDLSKLPYINFNDKDGKDKIFHVTISSKKIQPIFSELWNYVLQYPCDFNCEFDNVAVFKWVDNTWILYKQFFF